MQHFDDGYFSNSAPHAFMHAYCWDAIRSSRRGLYFI